MVHPVFGQSASIAALLLSALALSACVTDTLDVSDESAGQATEAQSTQEQVAPVDEAPANGEIEQQTAAVEPAPAASSQEPARTPRGASRQECAIFFEVMVKLAEQNRTSARNVAEGCPTDSDTGADFSPSGAAPNSQLAGVFRRKLIDRGTPSDLADQIIRSRAFAQLAGN